MERIYFDYAATTPTDPQVSEAMQPYFFDKFGNFNITSHNIININIIAHEGSIATDL